jgi:hypothetical protein
MEKRVRKREENIYQEKQNNNNRHTTSAHGYPLVNVAA